MKLILSLIFLLTGLQVHAQSWSTLVKKTTQLHPDGLKLNANPTMISNAPRKGACKGLVGMYQDRDGYGIRQPTFFYNQKENAFIRIRSGKVGRGVSDNVPYISTRWKLKRGKVVKSVIVIDSDAEVENKICKAGYKPIEMEYGYGNGYIFLGNPLDRLTNKTTIEPAAQEILKRQREEEAKWDTMGRQILSPGNYLDEDDSDGSEYDIYRYKL